MEYRKYFLNCYYDYNFHTLHRKILKFFSALLIFRQYPFYFTSCGHNIYNKCYEKDPQDHCMRFSKHVNTVKINWNLRSDLQMFRFCKCNFEIRTSVRNSSAVLDFQRSHHLKKRKQ
uniref:Uncharacterized protein n=1 Tax=Onchocerca volvulus TaxID=6282 RepID=A0A8R1TNQ0_ONCVO